VCIKSGADYKDRAASVVTWILEGFAYVVNTDTFAQNAIFVDAVKQNWTTKTLRIVGGGVKVHLVSSEPLLLFLSDRRCSYF